MFHNSTDRVYTVLQNPSVHRNEEKLMFIPCPDTALAVVNYTVSTWQWSNTYWFTKPNFTGLDLLALAEVVDGVVDFSYKPILQNAHAYVESTAYDMRTETGEAITVNDSAGQGANNNGESLGPGMCVVLTLYTNARGRSGRGRHYWGGAGEGDYASNFFSQTYANAVKAAYDAMVGAALSIGWVSSVVQRYENKVALEAGVPREITSTVVRSLAPGFQRRRVDRN
jgi:hypothetical protein